MINPSADYSKQDNLLHKDRIQLRQHSNLNSPAQVPCLLLLLRWSSFLRAYRVVGGAGLELSTAMISVPTGPTQYPLERLPELRTEYSVDYGIQRRVEVAKPQEERNHRLTDHAFIAQRHHQCHDEERQPADDECSSDNGQSLCRLSFPFRFQCLLPAGHLCVGIVRGRVLGQGQGGRFLPLLRAR